ncbi:unnamed protein product, partial [Staurois parvus]
PFINGLRIPCLCVLPVSARHCDPVPAVSLDTAETQIAVQDLCARSRSCDH